jgi:hypothetical protein
MLYDPKWQTKEFLSATALRISDDWLQALIKTLALMESGALVHIPLKEITPEVFEGGGPRLFNMGEWDCGTVGCIGGTAEVIGGVEIRVGCCSKPALHNLFYPGHPEYDLITLEQATRALRNYLTTGSAQWESIL